MRWLSAALFALLWTLPAEAQERRGRVLLEDGRSFEGVVLHLDQERIQLDVGGRRLTFKVVNIAKYEPLTPEVEPAVEAADPAAGAEPAKVEVAGGTAPAPEGTAPRTPQPRPQAPAPTARPETRWDMLARRLRIVHDRYPWIGPRGPLQWGSLGLLALLYVTLAMQLGCRFANAEHREGFKAFLAATVVVLASLVQLALVPFDSLTLPVLLVGNAAAWLLLTRILYGLGFFASCTMFFCAVVVGVVAFLVLEVVDYTLDSIGATAV